MKTHYEDQPVNQAHKVSSVVDGTPKASTSYDMERKPCGCELKIGTLPCNLHASAHDLLKLVKDMNYAFYYHGTRKHLLEVMQRSKQLIAKAEGK